MCRKPLITILALLFLLSLQVFVYSAESVPTLASAKDEVYRLIDSGRFSEASALVDKLAADFSENWQLGEVIHEIAQQYQESEKYDKAIELSQYALDNWPQTPSAIWLQMRIAACNIIVVGDAQEAISKLTSEYSQHPDLPRALFLLAEQQRLAWRYKEAKPIYQQLIWDHPDSSYARKAEFGLSSAYVMYLIIAEDYDRSEEALDKLIVDFNDYPDLPETLYWLADKYEWSNGYEQAKSIYQRIIQNYPDSYSAKRARLGIPKADVMSLICISKDYGRAEEAIDKLIVDFSRHPDLPEALYRLAERYKWVNKFEEEKRIYQRIVQNHPDSSFAAKAELGIPKADIVSQDQNNELQDPNQIGDAIDNLIADYNSPEVNLDLVETVFKMGEDYYKKARDYEDDDQRAEANNYFRKALAAWERIITEMPLDSEYTPQIYYFSAASYRRIGEFEKAIEYYQRVGDDWPDFRYAGSVPNLISWCYTGLKDNGSLSPHEADKLIEQSLLEAIEKFPDTKWARRAAVRLGDMNYYKGHLDAAAGFYEIFLESADPNDSYVQAITTRLKKLKSRK